MIIQNWMLHVTTVQLLLAPLLHQMVAPIVDKVSLFRENKHRYFHFSLAYALSSCSRARSYFALLETFSRSQVGNLPSPAFLVLCPRPSSCRRLVNDFSPFHTQTHQANDEGSRWWWFAPTIVSLPQALSPRGNPLWSWRSLAVYYNFSQALVDSAASFVLTLHSAGVAPELHHQNYLLHLDFHFPVPSTERLPGDAGLRTKFIKVSSSPILKVMNGRLDTRGHRTFSHQNNFAQTGLSIPIFWSWSYFCYKITKTTKLDEPENLFWYTHSL